jgi:hypothetical protein
VGDTMSWLDELVDGAVTLDDVVVREVPIEKRVDHPAGSESACGVVQGHATHIVGRRSKGLALGEPAMGLVDDWHPSVQRHLFAVILGLVFFGSLLGGLSDPRVQRRVHSVSVSCLWHLGLLADFPNVVAPTLALSVDRHLLDHFGMCLAESHDQIIELSLSLTNRLVRLLCFGCLGRQLLRWFDVNMCGWRRGRRRVVDEHLDAIQRVGR